MTRLLSPDDFPAFFHAVHGHHPFPWQTRLLRQVHSQGAWPEVLDLPTGSGKTAALDIAIFHLALSAGRPDRAAPMRIAFVVDRRLVVDEAYERATRIQTALRCPTAEITRQVAEALQRFSGAEQPLVVARLRGGVPREDDWARTPCQPTILCSTVDQVGSRLMFRGYGVSDRMAPVHAGLLGSDALILLDEAHLSEPFRQTLTAIAKLRALRGPDPSPFGAALLSATPGVHGDDEPFRLDQADRLNPVIAARLGATKPVAFRDIADSDDARVTALVAEALGLADRLRQHGIAAPIVGIVANRVARARSAFARLQAEHPAVLVIGRSRPIDRDKVAKGLDGLKTGRNRPEAPLFVVGTQAVEAGIDLDLDGLVTEAAPLDSLRQRFGRVDRAGRGVGAGGVVLGTRKARDADAIYGGATAATVAQFWPDNGTIVDFGIDATTARLDGLEVGPLLAPRLDAPVLMPAYVSLWARTSPRPTADPEPALFLHADREPASVQIVWRADLDLRLDAELLRQLLTLTPPRAGEVLELPVWAARQWLQGAAPDLADIAEPDPGTIGTNNRRAFRWAGLNDKRSALIGAKDVRPGDLLIVPAQHGGCDEFGWSPGDTSPVHDVFEDVSQAAEGRHIVVRIKPGLADGIASALQSLGDAPRGSEVIDAVINLVPPELGVRLANLPRRTVRAFFPYAPGDNDIRPGAILVAPRQPANRTGEGTTGDDDASAHANTAQTLRAHTFMVEATVTRFAEAMGLDQALADDLTLAARLHDAGKADPRFQQLLSDAGPFAPVTAEPLAKSAKGFSLPGAWGRARLPDHWRHEALSVRLAMAGRLIGQAHDRALVLYLIGSHHGFGRPFFPHADDADGRTRTFSALPDLVPSRLEPGPGPQDLGFVLEGEEWDRTGHDPHDLRGLDWFTIIRELHDRYGAWGLARLEATLRLADHRASAEGDTAP